MIAARRGLLLVALVAAVAGLPSLAPGFIHDDHRIIEQNELIRDAHRIPEILTRGYWTVDANAVPNLYRPVTILSFAADHALFGLRPLGYRAVNLALHALASGLVFLLALRVLGGAGGGALAAGLLFALHPVHTEVLGLVVGRSELLAAAGALLAVLLFLAARERETAQPGASARGLDALALAAFALGFLAKENAVAAPFLVLAADLTRPWAPAGAATRAAAPARPAWRVHAAFAGVLAALLLLRTAVLGTVGPAAFTHFVDNPIAHLPFPQSLYTALAVVVRYARLLVAPAPLTVDYSYDAIAPARSLLEPAVLAGVALLAGGAWACAVLRRRRPAEAFALAFMGLAFAPVSNLVLPIGTIMAERLLYLPSAGFALLAGAWVTRVVAPASAPGADRAAGPAPAAGRARALRVLGTAMLVVLGCMSVVRLRDWKDEVTLFGRAVAVAPRSVRAQFNFGAASEAAGDVEAAARAYSAALAIWPDFADAHYNLAGVLARGGRWDEAIAHYREALRQQPGNVTYLVNLGHALTRAGRATEAIEPLERAVGLDRGSDRAWNNLGAARLALGRPGDAAAAWRGAVRIDPASADYAMNLALALEGAGDPGAVGAWGAAVALRPGDGLLRYRLGRSLERAGRDDEAAAAYRESARLTPASPVPERALGLLLARHGDTRGAREALERAVRLDTAGSVMDAEARRVLDGLRGAP